LNLYKLNNLLSSETTFTHRRDIVHTLANCFFVCLHGPPSKMVLCGDSWQGARCILKLVCAHPPQRRDGSTRMDTDFLVFGLCSTRDGPTGSKQDPRPGISREAQFIRSLLQRMKLSACSKLPGQGVKLKHTQMQGRKTNALANQRTHRYHRLWRLRC
jgi:hypothetical protein